MPVPNPALISYRTVDAVEACNLSEAVFRSKYRSRKPVVIRGIAPSNPWFDISSMADKFQDPIVMVAHDNENFIDNGDFVAKIPLCDTTCADISQLHPKQRLYLRSKVPDVVRKGFDMTYLKAMANISTLKDDLMRLWFSSPGCVTPLHYDRCHGTLIQLVGTKRFVIFDGEETRQLYPCNGINGPTHASHARHIGKNIDINPAALLHDWPKMKDTEPWVVDLQPGDLLYTPPGFWHEVTSTSVSLSITIPWDMDSQEQQHIPSHMAF
ncbi:hypothetical protein NQZ79_g5642 [Umbelopsis isabellina]|nr:hypothetical protein NQZ79_g5642 [Umbelopsis isabellina]